MISLETYINESAFSVEELRSDYSKADGCTGQDKKDLIAKYSVESKKAKDIQYAILVKLQELRKNKKSFDKDDLRDFRHMWESDTQMIEQLKKESIDFAVFYRDNLFENLKKNKLEGYIGVKGLNDYRLSISQKWQIKHYQKVAEFIKSEDPDTKAQKMKDEDLMSVLNKKLTEELEDFKAEYLKKVEESSNKAYDRLPGEIKSMQETLDNMKKNFEERKKEIKGYMARWNAEEPIRKYEKKLSQKKAIIRMYATKKSFVDACLKDAEKTFKGNVDALTHRVYEKKFDVENIKVSNVKNDPKIFQLLIDDGNKKLYCRSILAAEFSDKMIPHFRFIMTERK